MKHLLNLSISLQTLMRMLSLAILIFSSITVIGQTSMPTISKLVFNKINQERKRKGIDSLIWNQKLETSSMIHASQMAKHDFYAHINPYEKKFKNVTDRLAAAQYDWSYYAENCVFITYPLNHKISEDSIASRLSKMWYNSPNHYKNIINNDYKETGIAILTITQDAKTIKYLVVQNFGTIK